MKQQLCKVFKNSSAPDIQEQVNDFLKVTGATVTHMNTVVNETSSSRVYVITIIYTA